VTFPNLLSGLFGAVLGVLGVVILQWRETRRQEAAAARVVFMEVAQNSSALNMARSIGVYVPLASSGWIAEQSRLAHALSPGDCVVVATFYMRVDLIRGRGFASSGAPIQGLTQAAEDAFRRGEAAAAILEKRGWWPWQRAALREKLNELVVKA